MTPATWSLLLTTGAVVGLAVALVAAVGVGYLTWRDRRDRRREEEES